MIKTRRVLIVLTDFLTTIWTQFLVLVRPMLKWLLRKVSGKCELLRITYEEQSGARQTKRVEKSLRQSKLACLKNASSAERLNVEETVKNIVQQKTIILDIHVKFEDTLRRCLSYIVTFNQLQVQVENCRKVKYSTDNSEHEAKLLKLWKLYMPDTPLESRISSQWGEVGFQGQDPATDFRGMGMLGLDQLVYFAEKYGSEATSTLSKSHHPKYGFSFAIVAINITDLQYRLLMKRKLRTHFYNLPDHHFTVDTYHEVYCYLVTEFTKFWFNEKPKDVMEFSRIRDKFYRHIVSLLKDPATVLRADFQEH